MQYPLQKAFRLISQSLFQVLFTFSGIFRKKVLQFLWYMEIIITTGMTGRNGMRKV